MASLESVSELARHNDLEANDIDGSEAKITASPRLVVSNEKTNSCSSLGIDDRVPETASAEIGSVDSNSNARLSRYYPGDVVLFREDKVLKEWMPIFGTVLNPSPGSEMEKNPDKGAVYEFHVHWDFTNRITLSSRPSVSLVDRVLLRGQRVETRDGDLGTVVDYEISATVLINGTEKVVKNVPLSRLRPVSPYVRGQEVLLKGWVGVITSIKRNVWFRMDGGLVFYMEVDEADGFTRVDPYWGLGVACPGMRTQLPSRAYKRAKWVSRPIKFLNSFLPLQRLYTWSYCTITRSEIMQLEVKWLQQAPGSPDYLRPLSSTVTREEVNDLVVIGTPSTETIGINSVRKLQILPTDEIISYNYWLEGFKNKFVDGVDSLKYPTNRSTQDKELQSVLGSAFNETPVKVLLRHNTVTLQMEDGSIQKIPAIDIPVISPTVDDGEFPMGLTVAPVQKNIADGDKYGIVTASIDLAKSRSRMVNLRWIVEGMDQGIQQVNIFDIRPHQAYSLYHRGTIVFPQNPSTSTFVSAVVVDLDVNGGKMVVKTSTDNKVFGVYPHQVTALTMRCHWSFFAREWILDQMIPPTYQLDLEFSPLKKLVDVSEQKADVLSDDINNPIQVDDSALIPTIWDDAPFELLAFAPETHRYYDCSKFQLFGKEFARTVEKEIEVLKKRGNVPEGIWVRSYENRLDLLSVLMVGPTKTPYEDGLFIFDIQLPADFPKSCPAVHYVSYTHEIHPLLSFDGNVCVHEISWTPDEDTESQIPNFLSKLQSMIFTPTPFFSHPTSNDDPSHESASGQIKARMYNQNVYVRILDSLWNMLHNPHAPWERTIRNHFASAMPEKYFGIEKWIHGGPTAAELCSEDDIPSYPLLPIPDGMRSAVLNRVEKFKKLLNEQPSKAVSVTDTTADSESFQVQVVHHQVPVQPSPLDGGRMLTPIAEMTEPSSTSTFGTKLSNITVPSDSEEPGQPDSLDSLKNVKQSKKYYQEVKVQEKEDNSNTDFTANN